MSALLHAVLDVGALCVLTWTAIFGGLGALLARMRDRPIHEGLAFGTLLGPIGWAVLCVRAPASASTGTAPVSDWSEV
jgi:hypothetical protein